MPQRVFALPFATVCLAAFFFSPALHAERTDWPWWRGPNHDGKAAAGEKVPLTWSETENVVWKVPVPGRGHGSPTVVGERVYLLTAERDREARSVRAFDRATGREVWNKDVHLGKLLPHKNEKASDASSTVTCDGKRLYVNFLHDDGMYSSALDLDGKILWQTRIDDYVVHQGYGASPYLYDGLVIVTADNKSGGAIAGLKQETGEIVWKQDRPKLPNYSSPIVHVVAGKPQLLMTGCAVVSSYDPMTGAKLWEFPGATEECVTTTPIHKDLMFTTGGYPKNHIAAVRCDGSGDVAWENGTRVYVPSLIVHEGYLYGIADAGVAYCWNCDTGEEQWKDRIPGTYSSSPVLVDSKLLATNESGKTYIFSARPDKFELLAENQLGEECFSTPAIAGQRIYQRLAAQQDGHRQEFLYCIGAK